jgi:hypothetical protein
LATAADHQRLIDKTIKKPYASKIGWKTVDLTNNQGPRFRKSPQKGRELVWHKHHKLSLF